MAEELDYIPLPDAVVALDQEELGEQIMTRLPTASRSMRPTESRRLRGEGCEPPAGSGRSGQRERSRSSAHARQRSDMVTDVAMSRVESVDSQPRNSAPRRWPGSSWATRFSSSLTQSRGGRRCCFILAASSSR